MEAIYSNILSILNYLSYVHGTASSTELHVFASNKAGTQLSSEAQSRDMDLTMNVASCKNASDNPEILDDITFLIILEKEHDFEQLSECLQLLENYENSTNENAFESYHVNRALMLVVAFARNLTSPDFQDELKMLVTRFPNLFSIDNEIYLTDYTGEKPRLYEMYEIEDRDPILERVAMSINDTRRLLGASHSGISYRRRKFNGATLNVVGVNSSEYTADTDFEWIDGKLAFKSGFSVYLLREMQHFYNFSVAAIAEDTWIDFAPTGELIGMTAKIISREADLALGITGNLPYSAKFFSFLVTTYSISISAFFKRQDNSLMRNLYFDCLQPEAWAVALSIWIIIPMILTVCCKLKSRNQFNFEKQAHSQADLPGLWIVGAISQSGWYDPPKLAGGTSIRILYLTGFCFSYLMYVVYSARLITVLVRVADPIKTPEDLIESPLTIGLKDEVDLKNWFEQGNGSSATTDNLVTTKIMENLDPVPEKQYILEIPSALQIVDVDSYAFISYPDPFYLYLKSVYDDHDTCKLYREVVIIQSQFRCSMFVAKSSPYKEHFNYIQTRLLGHGIIARHLYYYVGSFSVLCDSAEEVTTSQTIESIGIRDITTPLGFVVFGIMASFSLMVGERLFVKYLALYRDPYLEESRKQDKLQFRKPIQVVKIVRTKPKIVTTNKMQLFYLYGLLVCLPIIVLSDEAIKDGFYKIINVEDGTVLTATMSKQRPRIVITAPWNGSDEQMWKIKTKLIDGEPYQIIRNEKIRDNEVTKEPNLDKTSNRNEYIQTLWNIIKIGKARGGEDGYELNSGVACLKGTGRGHEIQYVNCVDSGEVDVEKSYLWRFEYLFDIPSFEPIVE